MKQTAEYLHSGDVIQLGEDPMRVLRIEWMWHGPAATWVRLQLRNLRTGQAAGPCLCAATTSFESLPLERKPGCRICRSVDFGCVFTDGQDQEYELPAEAFGSRASYLEPAMQEPVTLLFYEGRAVAVELPPRVQRVIATTEAPGRASQYPTGRKLAALRGCRQPVVVPAECAAGDTVEIDTRTGQISGPVRPAHHEN